MNHLIIYAHPNPESLNSQLQQTVVEALQDPQNTIKVRDLYQLGFNAVLSLDDINGQRIGQITDDVKTEQDFIRWAEVITFVYPIWWTGLPAILKGYIDRVFSYGFAYRYDQGVQKGLLEGKRAVIVNTHGKSHLEYEAVGMDKALSLTSDYGIYSYSGLEISKHFYFEKADRPTPEAVTKWKTQLSAFFESLDKK